MTITIAAGHALDFSAYLADYKANFVKDGYGSFSGDNYTGSQYSFAEVEDGGQGVVLEAAGTDWAYSMVTHTVTGSIGTIRFGTNITLDSASDVFTLDLDVAISGLAVEDSDAANTLLSELSASDISGLVALLKADDLNFRGSAGRDAFTGFGHNDTLRGLGGNDTLNGGRGADILLGGAGNDRLQGGAGSDELTGGAGRDVFVFAGGIGKDAIHDFGDGDRLSIDRDLAGTVREILSAATETDDGVVLRLGTGTVLLEELTLSDLARSDFLFV